MGKNQDECLAACNDQINNVGVTSSQFPNRETFVKREEFCITFMKLNRTCASAKRPFLTNKFPNGEFQKIIQPGHSDWEMGMLTVEIEHFSCHSDFP